MSSKFEHKIQTMVEGFELEPKPLVWDDIEKNLPQKENKRRLAFWWLLPVVLLVGGVLYIETQSTNNIQQIKEVSEQNLANEKQQKTIFESNSTAKIEEERIAENEQEVLSFKNKTNSNSEKIDLAKGENKKAFQQRNRKHVKNITKTVETNIVNNPALNKKQKGENVDIDELQENILATKPITDNIVSKTIEQAAKNATAKMLTSEKQENKPSEANKTIQQTLLTQKHQTKTAKKLNNWSYFLSIGNNINTNSIVSNNIADNNQIYASAPVNSTTQIGVTAIATTLVTLPQTGITLSAGVNYTKILSKQFELQTSLGIRYRNGKNFVGSDSLSGDSKFYTTGAISFTNNLWQAEFGVQLNTILNPKNKNQFFVVTGVNTQTTLSSNWLAVHTSINKYEANKSNSRLLLVNANLGFGYKFKSGLNFQLQVQQSLNSIKTNASANFFRNIELRTSIPFK